MLINLFVVVSYLQFLLNQFSKTACVPNKAHYKLHPHGISGTQYVNLNALVRGNFFSYYSGCIPYSTY